MKTIDAEQIWHLLPPRQSDTNKGSFGRVVAVAGSTRYRGAAALCTEGALRTGAGLVYLAGVEPVLQLVLARTPECCALPCRATENGCLLPEDVAASAASLAENSILLAGPGLGPAESAGAILRPLFGRPWSGLVLDADGLNALAAGACPPPPAGAVLTPHPGEMARLLHTDVATVQSDRAGAAGTLAKKLNCVAVLKGSGTLIATPAGAIYQNTTGNPGLARGGSGDILAGMIAGLLAQGLDAERAACCGVYLHGAAADRCAARRGMQTMLPQDIFDDLCALFAGAAR